ncbi:hypothetical protein Micbo1qcDRAFT_230335 [Microdochium bolleyi]|uniref:T6SS Phospholipase effector Tle1-like catalytic domain-containing protein n=1 Tax=Microdochium bolleyi TaxID=196109 RepID=A0A136JCT3_9PEZI|nr:hypothetical protein Micbo1qcDRAFT_230335 [Microdochium bolleyi]
MPSAIRPSKIPKRLIVCCDGTWQSSVTGAKNIPSNVTRLARSIAREGLDKNGQVWQQLVHYDAGIGTGELSKSEKDRQGGFGVGFTGNVISAYNFLVLNYSPGDKVYCFGFSRGAYTARAVAGLVNDIGILKPRDMQDFPDLFALYEDNKNSHGFRRSKAYREWVTGVKASQNPEQMTGRTRWLKRPHESADEASRIVEVVGVFDTVGSLGVPRSSYYTVDLALKYFGWRMGATKVGFHNVDLSPYIRYAFHALALDERRGPFEPTLWHLPPKSQACTCASHPPRKNAKDLRKNWEAVLEGKNPTEEELDKAWKEFIDREMHEHINGIGSEYSKGMDSQLLQVWFPGVHINVGGGNEDVLKEKKSDLEQIALISFAWMCEQIKPFLQLEEKLEKHAVDDRLRLIVPAVAEINKGKTKAYRKTITPFLWRALDYTGIWRAAYHTIPPSTVFGWATGPIIDSFAGAIRLAGAKWRTPGQYTHSPTGDKLGDTNEEIHPSVSYRKKKLGELPRPLNGFERRLGATRYEWVHSETGLTIPEYRIEADEVFTRHLASSDGKKEGCKGAVGGMHEDNAAKFLRETDEALAQLVKGVQVQVQVEAV